jgi:nicotinate-nucleotide adenylyltransferase
MSREANCNRSNLYRTGPHQTGHHSHITVYGGSFDPMHLGHLSMIERAAALDYTVVVVPAYRHAFGKQSAPFAARVRMCALALQDCPFRDRVHLCTIEQTLAQGRSTPVYTYDVLCALHDQLHTAPCLLVGPDITAEWTRWYRHADIDREFGRLCLPVTVSVRSTEIRQLLHTGAPVEALRALLPEPVLAYILAEGLYR